MNSELRRYAVVAGVLLSGAAKVFASSGSYVVDNFDGAANGLALSGRVQWVATDPSVMITNIGGLAHSATNVALVPILQNLTNTVSMGTLSNVVWSDFWTVPRPFQSSTDSAPTVDTNATAQLFVSNGYWVAISRDNGGALVTNSLLSAIPGYGSLQQVTNDGTSWCRVSVCHNYSNKVWSLFIGGVPVATNLGFINKGVSNYQWFAVQNGGGDSSNKTFLDDVLITNAVPSSLTNDANHNGLADAWELAYLGRLNSGASSGTNVNSLDGWTYAQKAVIGSDLSVSNPTVKVYAFGTTDPNAGTIITVGRTNATTTAISMRVITGSGVTNTVIASTNLNGPWSPIQSFYAGAVGTNQVTDEIGMNRSGQWSFYKVASTLDGRLTYTNEVKSGAHWLSFSSTGVTNIFTVPLSFAYGASNKLNSTLGEQLASGLPSDADFAGDDSSKLVSYPNGKQYWLKRDGTWQETAGLATNAFDPGAAFRISRLPGTVGWDGATKMLLGGILIADAIIEETPIMLTTNTWNLYAPTAQVPTPVIELIPTNAVGGSSATNSDLMVLVLPSGSARRLRLWADGTWRFVPNDGTVLSNTPWGTFQPGEVIWYMPRNTNGATITP